MIGAARHGIVHGPRSGIINLISVSMAYSLPSDVYSFGLALETTFMDITSASEFDQLVFHEGMRPVMDDCWLGYVKQLTSSCWCSIELQAVFVEGDRTRPASWQFRQNMLWQNRKGSTIDHLIDTD